MDIKALRKKAKLTQLELSRRVGVSRSTIAQYEAGIAQPGVRMLVILAKLFNVDLNEMKGSVVSEPPMQPLQRPSEASNVTEATALRIAVLTERLEHRLRLVQRSQEELMRVLKKAGLA